MFSPSKYKFLAPPLTATSPPTHETQPHSSTSLSSPNRSPATISILDRHVLRSSATSSFIETEWRTRRRVRFRNHRLLRRPRLHLWLRFPPLRYDRSNCTFITIIIIALCFMNFDRTVNIVLANQREARGVRFLILSTSELRDSTVFGECSLTWLRFSLSVE